MGCWRGGGGFPGAAVSKGAVDWTGVADSGGISGDDDVGAGDLVVFLSSDIALPYIFG